MVQALHHDFETLSAGSEALSSISVADPVGLEAHSAGSSALAADSEALPAGFKPFSAGSYSLKASPSWLQARPCQLQSALKPFGHRSLLYHKLNSIKILKLMKLMRLREPLTMGCFCNYSGVHWLLVSRQLPPYLRSDFITQLDQKKMPY